MASWATGYGEGDVPGPSGSHAGGGVLDEEALNKPVEMPFGVTGRKLMETTVSLGRSTYITSFKTGLVSSLGPWGSQAPAIGPYGLISPSPRFPSSGKIMETSFSPRAD